MWSSSAAETAEVAAVAGAVDEPSRPDAVEPGPQPLVLVEELGRHRGGERRPGGWRSSRSRCRSPPLRSRARRARRRSRRRAPRVRRRAGRARHPAPRSPPSRRAARRRARHGGARASPSPSPSPPGRGTTPPRRRAGGRRSGSLRPTSSSTSLRQLGEARLEGPACAVELRAAAALTRRALPRARRAWRARGAGPDGDEAGPTAESAVLHREQRLERRAGGRFAVTGHAAAHRCSLRWGGTARDATSSASSSGLAAATGLRRSAASPHDEVPPGRLADRRAGLGQTSIPPR